MLRVYITGGQVMSVELVPLAQKQKVNGGNVKEKQMPLNMFSNLERKCSATWKAPVNRETESMLKVDELSSALLIAGTKGGILRENNTQFSAHGSDFQSGKL